MELTHVGELTFSAEEAIAGESGYRHGYRQGYAAALDALRNADPALWQAVADFHDRAILDWAAHRTPGFCPPRFTR